MKAETGQRVWHFLIFRLDSWDYDLPCAPNLVDIDVGGKKIKAVVQLTKYGLAFVVDRTTGQAVWPINEHAIDQSENPGERSSKTQPVPTKPSRSNE